MATKKAAATKKKKRGPKKIKRNYNGPDWYLTEQSQTLCDLFEEDQAEFEAFDSTYADPFRTDVWQAAIDAAVNYKDDSTVVAEVQAKSDEVAILMKGGRDKYSEIMYFAQKAFGHSSPILKQFGKGKKYNEAAKSQGRMYNFLDELSQAANKHKVKLGTVNCTQAIIDSIATVRDAFNTGNRDQNVMKADRPEISQGRVTVNNALHQITNDVITAAKSVFKTNPAKQGQYTYHPPINHRDRVVIEITAAQNVITNIHSDAVEGMQLSSIQFEAIDSDFVVYASSAIDGPPGLVVLSIASGNTEARPPDALGILLGLNEVNHFMNTKNTGAAEGTLVVTFVKKKG